MCVYVCVSYHISLSIHLLMGTWVAPAFGYCKLAAMTIGIRVSFLFECFVFFGWRYAVEISGSCAGSTVKF